MENNYLYYNINRMNRQTAYRTTLNLSTELGINLAPVRQQWRNRNTEYWRDEVIRLTREVRNRDNNYNQALRLSRELREPLQLPNIARGTNYATWRREVRRLQMRARRTPQPIALRIPVLQAIQQYQPRRIIQQQRNQAIRDELIKKATERNIRTNFDRLIENNQFQQVLDIVVNDKHTLSFNQANRLYNNIRATGRYNVFIRTTIVALWITLNETSKDNFIYYLTHAGEEYEAEEGVGSDLSTVLRFEEILEMRLQRLERPNRVINNRDGQFFSYINTTNLDLSKYQIFNQEQAYNKELIKNREHCLLHSFLECGVSAVMVNRVKLSYIDGYNIRKKDIKNISSIIKRNINIHTLKPNGRIEIAKVKSTTVQHDAEDINIAMYESHYFKFEDTIYTKYFINNYEDLKNEEGKENIINSRIKNNKRYNTKEENKYKINSLLMVDKLFKQGNFKKLDLVQFDEAGSHKELKEHIYLDNINEEQSEMVEKEEKEEKDEKPLIYYADCESFVNGENHSLYLLGVVSDKNDNVSIFNVCDPLYSHVFHSEKNVNEVSKEKLVVNEFLNTITKNGKNNALCYFHNLKYDYHLLEPYINLKDRCEKDRQIYNVKIVYKQVEVELRDSYKIIPFALHKFQKEFNLPKEYGKKEAIAYTYYTEENNNKVIPTCAYYKLLSNDEQKIFKEQIHTEPTYKIDTKTFNPLEYYKDYLRLDCLVLKKGIQKFNQLIKEITENKMEVYECLTISSLTDKYMIKEGAYDGIYNMTGNLRAYTAMAVYGGRVNVNPKYKKEIIEEKIADYDGVSLYPSAINRLCREKGLPIGKATRYDKKDLLNWKNKTYSIMTVKINKVNKIQQMPFIAHKTEASIQYTNEAPADEIIIDSITLEDYINFHDIEYEILDGVYWNEGGNKKMGEVVKRLFETRLKYKTSNVALANVIKLMLNSAYGKTIMKKTKTEKKIIRTNYKTFNKETKQWNTVEKTPFKDYIYNNFNTIKNWRQLNENCYEVERVCSDGSNNRGHIGCAILSMSKRIMNEVFDIANDHELPIYYTDTDSIHCKYDEVEKLEAEYKKKYNKELNGKNLEQFHTDFNLDGAGKDEPIYATKSIFLGKKSYIDVLESKDKDGNIIKGYHIRLKGITEEGLLKASKEYVNSYEGLYTDLAHGIEKSIVLNPFNEDENKHKVLFEFKMGKVSTKKEFIRKVKF